MAALIQEARVAAFASLLLIGSACARPSMPPPQKNLVRVAAAADLQYAFPDLAAAFLGVAAYAACAPLNPSYRRDEFEFYLSDLRAKAIIVPADADLPARDVARRLGLIVLDIERSTAPSVGAFTLRAVAVEVESPPDWGRDEDIALVLHTSGTTSRPKQVPLSHRNLCSSLLTEVNAHDGAKGAIHIAELLDLLLDHMRSEERVFLAADVLTDEISARDYFGG